MIDQEYYDKVKHYTKQVGKANLLKYLEGKRLSAGQSQDRVSKPNAMTVMAWVRA